MIPPKAIEVMNVYGEADVLIDETIVRLKKGLYTFILVNGLPGTGKSYLSLRLKELIEDRLKQEFKIEPQKYCIVVDSLLDFVKAVRKCKKGDVIVVEELSVLFPSKRAMSSENTDMGKLLDTVRKKEPIIISNAPILPHIDAHTRAMANYLVETKRIDRKRKLTLSKVLRLQTNPRSGQTYFHTLIRKSSGKEVHYIITGKPSDETCKAYEKTKDNFIDDLYKRLEDKHQKKLDKENKELYSNQRITAPVPGAKKLTPRQEQVVKLYEQGLNHEEIAKNIGISAPAVRDHLKYARKKVFIVEKSDLAGNNVTLNKVSEMYDKEVLGKDNEQTNSEAEESPL